jgi:hypothetical protein
MRRVGVCSRSLSGAHRSARPGGSLASGWGDRFAGSGSLEAACCSRGALSLCVEAVAPLRGGLETSSAQPATCQLQILHAPDAYTHLLRLGVRRQPVRIEAFVVCHGWVWCYGGEDTAGSKQSSELICTCDRQLSWPGRRIQCDKGTTVSEQPDLKYSWPVHKKDAAQLTALRRLTGRGGAWLASGYDAGQALEWERREAQLKHRT